MIKQIIVVTAACVIGTLYYRGHASTTVGSLRSPLSSDTPSDANPKYAHHARRRLASLDEYKDPHSTFNKPKPLSSEKSKAVLLIGPHKTGTTALQKSLMEHDREITNDGYFMPWKLKSYRSANEFEFASCFLESERVTAMLKFRNDICPEGELSRVEQLGREGKNVLLSAECFSFITDAAALADFFKPWDVSIIYFHRWYHDALFSGRNQKTKVVLKQELNNFEKFMANRGSGKLLRPLTDQFERFPSINMTRPGESFRSFYRYRDYFDNVVTLNYDDPSVSITENVFCNGIKNANHTCNQIMQQKGEMVHINEAQALVYKNIAYSANQLAIASYCSREQFEDVVDKIQAHQECTLGLSSSDFPMGCLDKEILDRIIEVSLDHRRNIMPHVLFSKDEEDQIREDYWEKMAIKACDPDIAAILEMPEWVDFFNGLEKETTCLGTVHT